MSVYMPNKYRYFTIITSFLIVITSIATITSPVAAAESSALPEIVAVINGKPIYSSELTVATDNRIKQLHRPVTKANENESNRHIQHEALEALIDQELLAQAGAALNLKDTEAKIAKRMILPPGISSDNASPAKEQKEQIEARKDNIRKDILRESYLEQKGLLNPEVDEQTLRRFYEQNRQRFSVSKTVRARHILIRLPKAPTAEQEQEARNKADKILVEVKQGKDFELLAIQNSDCTSNENGGDLGFIKQGYMPHEFDAVAFSLKPSEISNVVKTRYGFHIIRIEDSKPESIMDFDKVKNYIAGYLKKDYRQSKIDELVDELKKSAKIEVLLP